MSNITGGRGYCTGFKRDSADVKKEVGHSGAIIGGRGYFSSGGDFDLKTTFYGLVLLNMTGRQLSEVSADIKTISVRPEIRSGRPFKVYAHYMLLSTV